MRLNLKLKPARAPHYPSHLTSTERPNLNRYWVRLAPNVCPKYPHKQGVTVLRQDEKNDAAQADKTQNRATATLSLMLCPCAILLYPISR